MYVGGSEARRPRAPGQNSNIKGASFFCASGAGWRCQLPPTRGGLVSLRSSEASGGGLCHRQQRRAARDCMLWPRTSGGAPCPPSSCLSRPPGAQGCQHEPNMAASITCAAAKSHLHITGTRANAESRQKCRPCSITWPRVLLEASGSLEGSWRAGRQHRREYWASSCCPALHVAAGSLTGRLQMPHSGVEPPDRRRWGAAGCSRQPQQAQNQDAPSICFSQHTHSRLLSEASMSIEE